MFIVEWRGVLESWWFWWSSDAFVHSVDITTKGQVFTRPIHWLIPIRLWIPQWNLSGVKQLVKTFGTDDRFVGSFENFKMKDFIVKFDWRIVKFPRKAKCPNEAHRKRMDCWEIMFTWLDENCMKISKHFVNVIC